MVFSYPCPLKPFLKKVFRIYLFPCFSHLFFFREECEPTMASNIVLQIQIGGVVRKLLVSQAEFDRMKTGIVTVIE